MCTVHSFPHNIDHCLTWARSEFEGLLEKGPAEANAYLADPAKYSEAVKTSADAAAREQLAKVGGWGWCGVGRGACAAGVRMSVGEVGGGAGRKVNVVVAWQGSVDLVLGNNSTPRWRAAARDRAVFLNVLAKTQNVAVAGTTCPHATAWSRHCNDATVLWVSQHALSRCCESCRTVLAYCNAAAHGELSKCRTIVWCPHVLVAHDDHAHAELQHRTIGG
jgi:hypothetical protein